METCTFDDLLTILEPWLDRDYIRKVVLTQSDQLVFFFTDGGQKGYLVDDCSKAQLTGMLNDIRKKGITVEKIQAAKGPHPSS